uniref:BT1 family protein n=1 Tax=Virus NIOZ-UU159 TaxID=2763270 RepID=A0A7S9XGM1_9VIRU|nr:MAG: BT1 family protein [Virus NIOZ-UU159]|tara:strand:+ start:594 stop:2036 length:1443 start_codon:yes stop_codon:yes gene_type:complete
MKKILILLYIYYCEGFIIPLTKIPHSKLKLNNNKIQKIPLTICNFKKINSIITNYKLKIYGIELTNDILAIALVYFVQGIIGLSSLAITFYYKDTLHLEPSELSFLGSITTIPWIIKPLYGFISDTYPLFGYKRKGYLILSGLLSSSSWLTMSYLVNNNYDVKYISIFLLTLSSLGIAFSDVLVDAIVVTKSKNKELSGSLQSICWTSSSIGSIISSYSSGFLLDKYGISWIFSLTALFPLITAFVGLYIKDDKVINNNTNIYINKYKEQFNLIIESFKNKEILYPLLFMFLWQAMPSSGNSLFYFETNVLNFNTEFFGRLSLVSSISSVLGIYIYNNHLKNISYKKYFKYITISGFLFSLTPLILVSRTNELLGLPDKMFAIGDDIILTILGQIGFMPILVLAAKISPQNIEASFYATIMSLNNLSSMMSSITGGIVTELFNVNSNNFDNLFYLLLFTNVVGLLPLLYLNYLPDDENKK